jgi:hypothetical protein
MQRWVDVVRRCITTIREDYQSPEHGSAIQPIPITLRKLLDDLDYGLETLDHWRLSIWLDKLQGVRQAERSRIPMRSRRELARIFAFLQYVLAPSQYVLLLRTKPRIKIMTGWKLRSSSKIRKRLYHRGGLRMRPGVPLQRYISSLDEQAFVKLVLVGSIDEPGSLRHLVWEILQSRPVPWPQAFGEENLSVRDLAKIMNGVHGPNGPQEIVDSTGLRRRELQEELTFLSVDDILRFREFIMSNRKRGAHS